MEIHGGNRVLAEQAMALAVGLMRRDGASAAETLDLLYGQLAGSLAASPGERDRLHERMRELATQGEAMEEGDK